MQVDLARVGHRCEPTNTLLLTVLELIPLDTPFLQTYPTCGILSLTILLIVPCMLSLSIS